MNEKMRFIARQGFIVREIAGEFMLVPMDTGKIHLSDGTDLPEFNGIIELNELSLFLYNQLKTPKTFSQLVQSLKNEYDTTNQNVEEDVNEFLDIGIKNQLVFILYGGSEENENI